MSTKKAEWLLTGQSDGEECCSNGAVAVAYRLSVSRKLRPRTLDSHSRTDAEQLPDEHGVRLGKEHDEKGDEKGDGKDKRSDAGVQDDRELPQERIVLVATDRHARAPSKRPDGEEQETAAVQLIEELQEHLDLGQVGIESDLTVDAAPQLAKLVLRLLWRVFFSQPISVGLAQYTVSVMSDETAGEGNG